MSLLTGTSVGEAGVVAASGGNFVQAIAWAAEQLEHRADIFVPATSPDAKIALIRRSGATVRVIAGYFQHDVRVIAVETDGTPTLHAARQQGGPVDVEVGGVAASALGARRIGRLAWTAQRWVDDALLVTDDEVIDAQQTLWREARLVAEPGGAAALAALTSGRYRPAPEERVAVLVCGATTGPATVR